MAAVVTNSLAASGLVGATPLGLLLTTGMVSVTTMAFSHSWGYAAFGVIADVLT